MSIKEKIINTGKVFYLLLIFSICVIPVFGLYFDFGKSSTENRILSDLPSLFYATEDETGYNINFTSELSDYLSENFAFRQELVTADSIMKCTLFRHSAEPKVVMGRNGWYYFNETVNDHMGCSQLSERGIYRLQATLDIIDLYAEQNNITFVFFSAPNKNSIYPQFMPFNTPQLYRNNNLERLSERMDGKNYYIDVKSLLKNAASSDTKRNYYLKNDSHWNNLGALTAFNALENNLNSRIKDFDLVSCPIQDEYTEYQTTGDLTDMLYPALELTDVQYDLGITKSYSSDRPLTDLMANDILTTCSGRYYSAICYRDSFSNAMIGIMSNAFANVRYTRSLPYDINSARNGRYNIAVIELAERNLPLMLNEAPVLDAVMAAAPKETHCAQGEQSCNIIDREDSIYISGRLGGWSELEECSDIFIELRNRNNESFFYHAFPISEGDPYDDSGFSVLISKYVLSNGEYKAFIHVGNSDKTIYVPLKMN